MYRGHGGPGICVYAVHTYSVTPYRPVQELLAIRVMRGLFAPCPAVTTLDFDRVFAVDETGPDTSWSPNLEINYPTQDFPQEPSPDDALLGATLCRATLSRVPTLIDSPDSIIIIDPDDSQYHSSRSRSRSVRR